MSKKKKEEMGGKRAGARERERERERESGSERERVRERDRQTDRQTDRDRERQTETERQMGKTERSNKLIRYVVLRKTGTNYFQRNKIIGQV